jgi:mono/diheme cytochrome c family protein
MRRVSLTAFLAAAFACITTAAVATIGTASAAIAPSVTAPVTPPVERETAALAMAAPVAQRRAPQPPNKYAEVCAACHQATGAGVDGAFPPLDGSEWLTGRADIPIAIVLHGLQGEITVKGKKYNGAMMPWATALSDAEIAAILTYARSSWSNRASPVTVAQVRAARTRFAARSTPWTATELRALR